MSNENLEKLLQNANVDFDNEFIVLNTEEADNLFGGKFICVDLGRNNGNCR